jgi:cation transport regulator ChaB
MVTSEEPITPKADQRVIDGEVVNGGHAKSEQKNRQTSSDDDKPLKAKRDWSGWWPQTFMQKMALLLVLLLVGIITYLAMKTNQQDWQIEKINQLQSEVGQLKTETKTLKSSQNELKEALTAKLASPENQPAISQADVDAVKTELETFKTNVQDKLSEVTEQLKGMSQQAGEATQKLGEAVKPSPEFQAKAEALGDEMKNQLQQMGQQLSELFDFKQEQQERNEWQKQQDSKLENATETAASAVEPLSAQQIRQWALEVNTQWLLTGNVAQTRHHLLALEKAVGASAMDGKNDFIRRIGQDLARIDARPPQSSADAQPVMEALREQIRNLPPAKKVSHETPIETPDTTAETSETATDSAWQKLQTKLEALFSVRKRESAEQLTQVESLMMHDVLIQRGLLLADRVQWALDSESKPLLDKAIQALNDFMAAHFPEQAESVKTTLAPLQQIDFEPRQPLDIAEGA